MTSIEKKDVGDHLTNISKTKEVVVSSIDEENITLRWLNYKPHETVFLQEVFTIPCDNFKRSGWSPIG